ncbi:MAG: ABC transporter permease [Pseudomonadota bacterium]
MSAYILSRLFRAALTLLITVSLVFVFIRFSGDPAAALVPPDAPEEVIEQYRQAMGLDQPLWKQYTGYIGGILQGDFGYSVHTGRAVEDIFLDRLPYTLRLGLTALVIALTFGIGLGVLAAIRRGTLVDRVVMGFSVFAFAMPNFLFGLVLILVGALVFQVFLGGADSWVLMPALTLGLAAMGSFARFARSSLLETINAPYMRAAEARGVPFRRRILRHAIPNAAIPLVTLIGLSLGALIAGSVVTEQVFAWPGVGQLLVRSVATRDIATVQFLVLAVAATMVVANLVVDLLYLVIDPRIRAS